VEIRQALLNLVRNAIAAVPTPNGVVRIGWSEADGLVRVSIDNPIANRRRAPGGMGMGLMIARTIAQAHGGGVSVAATSSGVRSTLDLPVEGIDR
jgi:signal transduction histidine kinase